MFRLAEGGMVKEYSLYQWAHNMDLTFVAGNNTQDQSINPNDDDADDVSLLLDHL